MKKLLLIMIVSLSLIPNVVFASMIKIEEFRVFRKAKTVYHSEYYIRSALSISDSRCRYYFPMGIQTESSVTASSCDESFIKNGSMIKIGADELAYSEGKAVYQAKHSMVVAYDVNGYCEIILFSHHEVRVRSVNKSCEEFFKEHDFMIKMEGHEFLTKKNADENVLYQSKYHITGARDTNNNHCIYYRPYGNESVSQILKQSCEEFFKGHDFMIKIEADEFLNGEKGKPWYQSKYSIVAARNIGEGHCEYLEFVGKESRFRILKKNCEEFFKEHDFMIKIEGHEFLTKKNADENVLYQSKYHIMRAENNKDGNCEYYIPYPNEVLFMTFKKNCEDLLKQHNIEVN